MAMVKTCPHCATSFNVAPEVLLSHNGRVRCGQCKQIFDGRLSVTTLEQFQSASGVPAGARAQALTPLPVAPPPIIWPALPDVPEVPIPPMPLEIAAAASPAYLPVAPTEIRMPLPVGPAAAPVPTAFNAHDAEESRDVDEALPAPSPRARVLWAIAAVLAVLALAGQLLYRYRGELAANVPVLKPVLAQLCAWAGCRVPPLQQPAMLNIEASDLQIVDPAKPHIVQLTATLRNRAAIDVGYPALDLVLTDNREHALARRVFLPTDYLTIVDAEKSAIAANAETTVRIDMDISGLPAAGFRLNLTPAPSN